MRKTYQVSESLRLAAVLTISGGFMDAYSFICRGGVFANAQTGNILLTGVCLSTGNWAHALSYFIPVVAFSLGIAIAEFIRHYMEGRGDLHWRQLSVLAEAFILLGVAFMPQSLNLLANSLTSFACGIQVESFRKLRGNGFATTMCIGNLRSGTQALCEFAFRQHRADRERAVLYFSIIGFFVLGAVIGNLCVLHWAERAILVSSGLLLAAFAMMFIEYHE